MTSTKAQPSLLTVVVAFQNERLRNMMIKSFSKHNRVSDLYCEPSLPLMDVPCFIRLIDKETYQTNEKSIIEHYQDCDIATTPPMIVFGLNMNLYAHPLIIDLIRAEEDYCIKLYRNTRRRATRGIPCT